MPIIIYHLGGELREVPVRDKTLSVRSLYTALNSLISCLKPLGNGFKTAWKWFFVTKYQNKLFFQKKLFFDQSRAKTPPIIQTSLKNGKYGQTALNFEIG